MQIDPNELDDEFDIDSKTYFTLKDFPIIMRLIGRESLIALKLLFKLIAVFLKGNFGFTDLNKVANLYIAYKNIKMYFYFVYTIFISIIPFL